jgi:fluoride ion exporter CrcB/FEX
MIQNYFKTALKTLPKFGYTFLNVAGLFFLGLLTSFFNRLKLLALTPQTHFERNRKFR